MRIERTLGMGALVVAAALGGTPASAQVGDRVIQMQRENAAALQKYQWKSRTEVRRGGEAKGEQLFLMRYGTDGALQKTRIGGSEPPQRPRGPLRRKIAERKIEAVQDRVGDLAALAQSYAHLPPEKLQAVLAAATMVMPLGKTTDTLQVKAANVLRSGDAMTIWIDSATHQQRKAEIRTFLEGEPVTIVTEFRTLPDGPTYAARAVIDDAGQGLQVVTDNFDYER